VFPSNSASQWKLRTSKSLVVTSGGHGMVPMNSPPRDTAHKLVSLFEKAVEDRLDGRY